jgi:hypothetical protein
MNVIVFYRMVTKYMKAIGSLLMGVASVMVAYNIGDGHGIACDIFQGDRAQLTVK